MFRRPLLALAVAITLPVSAAFAQRIAPAVVVRHRAPRLDVAHVANDSSHSLSDHMKRGATFGAIGGAAVGALATIMIGNSRQSCCDRTQSDLTFRQGVGIVAIGAAGGALVGAILGYGYHFNRPK